MIVPLQFVLSLAAILFTIGTAGVLLRRNVIVIFMSIEIMLNGANLALIGISRHLGGVDGQILVLMVMTVAAAEAAVGLAIILAVFRNRVTVNADELNLLKW